MGEKSLQRLLRLWSGDELIRRLVRNIGYLLSGNLGAALLGLVALALSARALGPELLGVLALIEAYVRLIDRLVRLEPWQALIKYGADALEQDRRDDFRSLLKFGSLIDLGGAAISTIVAVAMVVAVGPWLGWSDETVAMAAVYSLILLFHLSATPIAVLRLFDRFAVFAVVDVATAAVRVAVFAVAFMADAGLWTFLLLTMFLQIARHLALVVMAWRELHRRSYTDFLRARLAGVAKRFPGIWSFVWSLKASFLARRSTGDLDILIIGSLLDSSAVGLYHIAKRLGDAALKLGVPIQQAVFPDLARLWARQEIDRLRAMVNHVNLAAGGLAIAMVVFVALYVDLILELSVGAGYAAAALLVVLQLMASATQLLGIALRPALLSMGMQIVVLKIIVLAAAGFYVTLGVALPILGVVGASLAHVVLNAIWLIGAFVVFNRRIRQEARACAPAGLAGAKG